MKNSLFFSAIILLWIFSILAMEERYYRRLCGFESPLYYNLETHDCKNGKVIRKVSTKQTKRPCETKVTSTYPRRHTPAPKPSPDPAADILNCTLSLQTRKTKGRKCCGGFDTYNPRFETCCQRGLKSAVRHKNKKERDHACCTEPSYDLNIVYRRGSREIPCKHPSLNDKLFRGQHKLNALRRHCEDCREYNFAYTVRIHQKTNLQLSEYYNATITKWPWKSPGDYKTSYNKLIPIDKYSPKVKRIRKKVFIVLSNYDQSQNLDFYLDRSLGTEDEVFKDGRTTHKFNKRFNRLWRKCRKKISRSKS